ncbi:hypothetical protein [Mangrovibacterium marinum]|uniref:Uncharacterized protein n=1 Tax=Mangrovibacterium marinum TaxID=1639118 RepID=A0A2T5C4S5_9BACT|nr:hypothetical protein [Mangrovibacterium marinum]PTN09843.1 hypothetical protein C8N47_103137 [Mangrovibacterium marinum]
MTERELTPEEKQELSKHDVHFTTLLKIYGGTKGFLYSPFFWIAFGSSLLFIALNSMIKGINEYLLILKIKDLLLSTFPSILGFNIGAYALVIGFGDKEVLDKIRNADGENGYSLFQTIGGTFAVSVLIQATTFMLSFIIDIFIYSWGDLNILSLSETSIICINRIIAFIILFAAIYSTILIPKIVLNVFSFSQLYHFFSKNTPP